MVTLDPWRPRTGTRTWNLLAAVPPEAFVAKIWHQFFTVEKTQANLVAVKTIAHFFSKMLNEVSRGDEINTQILRDILFVLSIIVPKWTSQIYIQKTWDSPNWNSFKFQRTAK